jgi:hypothetical protein
MVYAASVVVVHAYQVLQTLCPTHHGRIMTLLAGGKAAGAALLAEALEQGTLLEVPGMVEAACSGLVAACRHATALAASSSTTSTTSSSNSSSRVPNGEAACLGDLPEAPPALLWHLRSLVGVVVHLATHPDLAVSSKLAELRGCLVPALTETLGLLLRVPQLPESYKRRCFWVPDSILNHCGYHDAAWAALLALSECPQTTGLVAALFQHQPGLLQALAASWDMLPDHGYLEKAADTASRLATCLLLSGSIPGQQERRQHEQLLVAAVSLWDMVNPKFWRGRADQLMELLRLPHGPRAVALAPQLLDSIFPECAWDNKKGFLGPGHIHEGLTRLLAAPDFHRWLVEGLQWGSTACLAVVDMVWYESCPEQTQALLAVPGLADALTQFCSRGEYAIAVDWILGDALCHVELQEFLGQHPQLLQALVARLFTSEEHADWFWHCLVHDASGDEWLLQQPALLGVLVCELVAGDDGGWTGDLVQRFLGVAPSRLFESLLRQPALVEQLLRVLVRPCQQQQQQQQQEWQPEDDTPDINWPHLLLEGLAGSQLAPRAWSMLPGLLAQGDAELSAGVFEAMNIMQRHMAPGSIDWGADLAATSSQGTAVLCVDEQLAALTQGAEEVFRATAVAGAATRQLQEQHRAMVAGVAQPAAQDHPPRRSKRGNRQVNSCSDQGGQQQLQQGVAPQQVGGSGQRKSKRIAAAGQLAVVGAGSQRGAGGRLVPGKALPAPAAAPIPDGDVAQGAGAPPAPKRTRR